MANVSRRRSSQVKEAIKVCFLLFFFSISASKKLLSVTPMHAGARSDILSPVDTSFCAPLHDNVVEAGSCKVPPQRTNEGVVLAEVFTDESEN